MKKNIVILRIENGSPSGVVRYIEMLTEGLKSRNNFEIHIICLNTNLIFPEFIMNGEQFIANIPYPSKSKPLKNEFYWLTKYFNVISDLLLPYFNKKTQIVWHVQELFLVKLAYMLKLSIGGYVLTHLHMIPWKFNLEYNENYFKMIYTQWLKDEYNLISKCPLEKVAYPISDRIICVSLCAKKHIISAYKINSDKISVIYNGLDDQETYFKGRKEVSPELLFVGRISREKGVIGLLNALNIVYNRGYRCKLNLIGQCTQSMTLHIQKVYKKLDIKMLGVTPFWKLKELYSKNVIGIIPSLHEQCSYTAIEMSMFGIPIIVSDVDALSEMFEDEVNALKIPLVFDEDFGLELDEEKLADAIIRMIDDKVLRQKLSVNAIRNFQERFTLEKMIEATINVYEQLIKQDNA